MLSLVIGVVVLYVINRVGKTRSQRPEIPRCNSLCRGFLCMAMKWCPVKAKRLLDRCELSMNHVKRVSNVHYKALETAQP